MKALSLHGPWAYYERKAAENERRIADLEQENLRWKSQLDELQQKLEYAEVERKQLHDVQLPGLLAEKGRSQSLIDSLQAELARERLERADEHRQLTLEVSSLTQELQKLSADNAVLRSELAKTVHQKQLTSSKLEQIRKKLGLSESEAKAFIQELDEARAASKALREENKELAADNMHLKQQVESRSQHCMTLIGENKRLLEQVADLRMQLQKQQGDLWQAKTEQQTAMAAARQLQQQQQQGIGPGGLSRKPHTGPHQRVVIREWSAPTFNSNNPSSKPNTKTDSTLLGMKTPSASGTKAAAKAVVGVVGPRSSLTPSSSSPSTSTSLFGGQPTMAGSNSNSNSTSGGGGGGGGSRHAGGSGAGGGTGGKQNRPPWSDTAGSSTSNSSKGGSNGDVTKPLLVQVPVLGIKTAVGVLTGTAKAGVVRQALAVRNQRLASAQQQQQEHE